MKIFMFRFVAISIGLLFFNQSLGKCTIFWITPKSVSDDFNRYEACNSDKSIEVSDIIENQGSSLCNEIKKDNCKIYVGKFFKKPDGGWSHQNEYENSLTATLSNLIEKNEEIKNQKPILHRIFVSLSDVAHHRTKQLDKQWDKIPEDIMKEINEWAEIAKNPRGLK